MDLKKHSWRYDQVWPRFLFMAWCFALVCYLWMNWFGELHEPVRTAAMFLIFFAGMAGALAVIGVLIRSEETAQSRQAEHQDVGDLRLEYEALSQKVSTRESSNLTIVTFMAASALVFFGIVIETDRSFHLEQLEHPGLQIQPLDWRIPAFALALVAGGIVYRELTVFTIDRVQNSRMRKLECNTKLFPEEVARAHPLWGFLRSIVFRAIIWAPGAALLRYLGWVDNMHWILFALVVWLSWYPLPFSVLESWMIRRM